MSIYKSLVEENSKILQRFIDAHGVRNSKEYEFEFICTFQELSAALSARSILKEILAKHEYSSIHIFVVNDGLSGNRRDCKIHVKLRPDALLVSEIEEKFIEVSEEYGGSEVSWGFMSNENVQ